MSILGVLLVALAGLGTGTCAWPMKVTRRFQFEQSWFVGMLVGLIIIPWSITLIFCPHALMAYKTVPPKALIISNIWAVSWGIANMLYGICVVRIGMALTGAILGGLGVSVGVTMPMIIKGSGLFKNSPDIVSVPGIATLVGVTVMLIGVVLVTIAGFGRDTALKKSKQISSGGFLGGLIMSAIAGVTSAGISLAFVYSQDPIRNAMKANGAGDIPANVAVWAAGLFGGALLNVLYPAYLMTKNKSWGMLGQSGREIALGATIGIQFIVAVNLLGKGMVLLGPLGASVGFGIQQAMQLLGNQGAGFISGEWRGVHGIPRRLMYYAILILIAAAIIMAYANTLTTTA